MRRLGLAVVAILALGAAPALAVPPSVYRSPFIPADLFEAEPADGTVSLLVQVWNGSAWASEGLVVVPGEHVLPVECTTLPGRTT